MENTYRYSLLCLFLSFIAVANAQIENPAAGYVITTQGDTLRGVLNLDNEVLLSKGVYWQAEAQTGQVTYYTATDLQEFGFDASARTYCPVVHTYTRNDDTLQQSATRLARVLYDGPLKLFRLGVPSDEFYKVLEDIPPWAYYLQTEQGEYVKLEVTEKQLNSTMGYPYAKYKGPLKYLMRDWPSAVNRIEKTRFTDEDMVELVVDYIRFKYPDNDTGKEFERKKVTKYSHFLQLTYGGWSGDYEQENALTSTFGGGYLLKAYNPFVDNSFELAVGLEYLILNYADAQANQTIRFSEGWMMRLPVYAEFYLTNKWKNVQPRLFGVLLPTYISREGERLRTETIIVNGMPEEVPVGFFPFSGNDVAVRFAGGLGVDLYQRFRVDVQYEKHLGFLLRAGVQL